MSRSGYSDDCDGWALVRWRGAVNSAIRGNRGQAFLRELASAMDSMSEKRLIADEIEANGEFCTLGVIAHARGLDTDKLSLNNVMAVARELGIAEALAREIVYENDEGAWLDITPNDRWHRMRRWVDEHIVTESTS